MDTSAQTAKLIVGIIIAVASLVAGWLAVLTYRQSVKLERAKWMKELYEKFYEQNDLKDVRDLLDNDDQNSIAEMVKAEPRGFTDYLNFFEFLAYLFGSKQITKEEVFGLLTTISKTCAAIRTFMNTFPIPRGALSNCRNY